MCSCAASSRKSCASPSQKKTSPPTAGQPVADPRLGRPEKSLRRDCSRLGRPQTERDLREVALTFEFQCQLTHPNEAPAQIPFTRRPCLFSPRCDEIDRSLMATRFAPSHIDTDNSPACLPAARNDWHRVSRFHVGTGQCEPATDAGYTTARVFRRLKLSVSFLPLRGSPYRRG